MEVVGYVTLGWLILSLPTALLAGAFLRAANPDRDEEL